MRLMALEALLVGKLNLPPGYYVELDADLLELHPPDGTLVAAFSARGTAPAEVVSTAQEDNRTNGKSSA
jgi:hypothetical protein